MLLTLLLLQQVFPIQNRYGRAYEKICDRIIAEIKNLNSLLLILQVKAVMSIMKQDLQWDW